VRELEDELKRAVESCRGTERALEKATAALDDVQADMERTERENKVVVQQIVTLTKELQEAKDAQEEALLLMRQCV
jgi:uncharacterized coiled-coil DUF342 family protein